MLMKSYLRKFFDLLALACLNGKRLTFIAKSNDGLLCVARHRNVYS